MDPVIKMLEVDYVYLVISVCAIILGIKFVVGLFEWLFIDKLGLETKWIRRKREEHDLLIATANGLKALQEKHEEDTHESNLHDEIIKNDLNEFMEEIRDSICITQNSIKEIHQNRLNDREKSREIQQELKDSIASISDGLKDRDRHIDALILGSKELLGNIIDERFDKYTQIGGIPANEVGEFDDAYAAYKGLNGNHTRDAKFRYAKSKLPIIPVKTKLIIDDKD